MRLGYAIPIVALRRGPVVTLINNLFQLIRDGVELRLLFAESPYIDYNRILLVKEAQAADCTHIFMMDHDMVFPPDTVQRLLAHDVDIVGAAYNMRSVAPPLTTVILEDAHGQRITDPEALPKERFRALALGAGCLLINLRVFDKIERPWFSTQIGPDDVLEVSEDVWFCNRARAAGFDVWCDPTIEVKHMGEAAY